MKNQNTDGTDKTIQDLEIAFDILQESAIKMRPGSLPHVQLHRMIAVMALVLENVKLERKLVQGAERLN